MNRRDSKKACLAEISAQITKHLKELMVAITLKVTKDVEPVKYS
jgi:hypothetical protein